MPTDPRKLAETILHQPAELAEKLIAEQCPDCILHVTDTGVCYIFNSKGQRIASIKDGEINV